MPIWSSGNDPNQGKEIRRERDKVNNLARLDTRSELEAYQGKARWLLIAFLIPFLAIVGRLWQLQITDTAQMRDKARNNLVRTSELPADRGLIYDANRNLVAENRVAYDVHVDPRHFKKNTEALSLLRDYLNLSGDEVRKIERKSKNTSARTFIARRDVTRDQVALIESNLLHLPGVEVVTRAHRYYPFNELGAHMLGFMNEISARELDELDEYGYRPGDYVGRTGLERSYEAILRGSPGLERKVVNARGVPQGEDEARELLGEYRRVEPVPGRNLVLTANMELQEIMLEAFSKHTSGASVAIDPRDGSILGMLSKPTFNPNSWTGRLSAEEKRRVDNDPFKPMLDKTTQSNFPGSTFKLVTALAAVSEGHIKPDETLKCPGFYEFGKRRFHCWHRAGHGGVDMTDSLKYSCDVYYYKTGEKLGMDVLARYAYMFGFGERTGLGINGEQRGRVPTKDWHRKNSPEGFQHGFTLSTAVGQGDTRVTPLQLALAYGALANGGTLYHPRLVDKIETAEGREVFKYPKRVRREIEAPEGLLEKINVGMASVVNEMHGTVYNHRLDYVAVAGKTGTAQVRGFSSQRLSNGEVILRHRDHSWFVGYAPVENPEIVVVTFVEHGGSGSKVAAPVAMNIIDRYFREIKGVDPEAEKALARANRRNQGLRRLGRAQPQEDLAWERPGGDKPQGAAGSELIGAVNDPENTRPSVQENDDDTEEQELPEEQPEPSPPKTRLDPSEASPEP